MQLIDKFRENSQPLLTIAIPTYNRAIYLDICLRRISEELDSLSEHAQSLIKIYISNNASTDHTDEIVSKYKLIKAGKFEFVRNEINIGGDRNVEQCYMSATSTYVWVLGDDDVILTGGLTRVLDVLRRQDVDILSIGCKGYVNNHNEKPNTVKQRIKNSLHVFRKKSLQKLNAVEFTKRTNISLTFISSLIVKTGYCNSESLMITRGTYLSQMSWVASLLCNGSLFGIIDVTIVAAKMNNSGGYSLVQVFGRNLNRITDILFKDKPHLAKIIQNGAIVNFFPSFIIVIRKVGNSYTEEKNLKSDLNILYNKNWRYYIFVAPLILMPLCVIGIYSIFINALRRILSPVIV
jgi:glycosyltransferase involved in cell wall biosynthesis